MMKHYRYYDEATGLFHSATVKATDPKDALAGIPAGHRIIEGEFDHLSQRVEISTGQIVDYQPPQPSQDHEWNPETKRWQLCAAAERRQSALVQIAALEATQPRAIREALLGRGGLDRLREIDDQIAALRKLL